jgi:hypothetical protein
MGWVVNATPRALYLPGKTKCPLYRRLGWTQGRSGREWKTSPPPGFDPQIAQPLLTEGTKRKFFYQKESYMKQTDVMKFYMMI